jgi:hypothetical protein
VLLCVVLVLFVVFCLGCVVLILFECGVVFCWVGCGFVFWGLWFCVCVCVFFVVCFGVVFCVLVFCVWFLGCM